MRIDEKLQFNLIKINPIDLRFWFAHCIAYLDNNNNAQREREREWDRWVAFSTFWISIDATHRILLHFDEVVNKSQSTATTTEWNIQIDLMITTTTIVARAAAVIAIMACYGRIENFSIWNCHVESPRVKNWERMRINTNQNREREKKQRTKNDVNAFWMVKLNKLECILHET